MDLPSRISSAEQQTFELHKAFSDVERRLREFTALYEELVSLHSQTAELRTTIAELQKQLADIYTSMPLLARKEELERFSERLDAIPFEHMVRRK